MPVNGTPFSGPPSEYGIILPTFAIPAECTGSVVSVLLSDRHGRYGLCRIDNGQVLIAAAQPYPTQNGSYRGISIIRCDVGTPYEFWVQVTTSDGVWYFHQQDSVALPADSPSAGGMAERIRVALRDTPGALINVTVDGQMTTWSRKQAVEELQYWERRAAREAGRRPRVAQIGMDF